MGKLWIAQVALFAIGWLGPWRDAPARGTNGRVPLPVRMALSASLVAAAWLVWRASAAQTATYCRFVFLGMAASFVGDLVMARLLPVPNRLVGGMIAFGLAHGLYIAAYVRTLQQHGAAVANAGLWLGFLAYGAGSIGGWRRLIRNPLKGAAVNAGALAYGTWIGIMASFALALAVGLGGAWWLAAIGGLSFVASDFLIGVTDIRGVRIRNANDWIWLTYAGAQMGIIYAAWALRAAPGA